MRRALVIVSLLLLAAVVGVVLLVRSPYVQARLKAAVLAAVSDRLAADVRLEGVRLRLLPLALELSGLSVTSRARPGLAPILEARRVRVAVDPVLLLAGRLDVDRVEILEPNVTLVVERADIVNLPKPIERSEPGGQRGRRLDVVVRSVVAEGGAVRLDFPLEGPLRIDVAVRRLALRPDIAARAATFDLALGASELSRKRFRQPLDEAEARGRVTARGIEIESFRGRAAGIVAVARGRIAPFPHPDLELKGSVGGPLAAVTRIYIDPYTSKPFALSGQARATFSSSGPASHATFEAQVTATDVRVAAVSAPRIVLDTRVTYDRTTVRSGTIEAGGGAVAVTGWIDYDEPIPFHARLSTAGIRAAALAAAVGAPPPPGAFADAVASGGAEVDGAAAAPVAGRGDTEWRVLADARLRVAAPAAAADGALQPPAAAAVRALLPAAVEARVELDPRTLRLRTATVKGDPAGGPRGARPIDLEVAGQVGFDAPRPLALDGRIEASDLSAFEPLLGRVATDWAMAGRAAAKGRLTGPAAAPTFTGEVTASGLSVGRYRIGDVSGPVTLSRRQIASRGLDVRLGATRGSVSGRVDLPAGDRPGGTTLDLEVSASPLVAEEALAAVGLDLPVRGRGRLTVRLSGPLQSVQGAASVELTHAEAYGQPLDRVEAALALGPGTAVRVTRFAAAVGPGRLTGRASRGADGQLAGAVALERLPIGAIRPVADLKLRVAGSVSGQATLAGTWRAPRVTARVGLAGVAYEGAAFGDSGIDVALNWPNLSVRGTLVQREVGIVANASLEGARPFVVALDLENPNLAPYLARMAEGRTVRASAHGVARAAGSLNDLEAARAEVRLDAVRIDVGDFYLQNVGEVAVAYERRVLSVISATMQGPTSQAVFGGQVDLGARTLDLRVNGGLDLSFARLFTDRLSRSRGTARIVAQAVGGFDKPRLYGAAQVEGGALTLRGVEPAVSVEDLAGIVAFDQSRVVVDGLTMRIGEGQAKLAGAIELTAFRPSVYNLTATFDAVQLAVPRWLPSTVRGDLRLSGRPAELLVSGHVEVIRATYNRRVDVSVESLYRAIRAALEPRRATRPEATEGGPRVDIRIRADNEARVETGLFDAELRANLQLVGRLPEPNLLGSVEVISGTITFRDTKFNVTSGRADFVDPFRINPSFDLTAEATLRDYQIRMHLSGTVDKYRLEFSSPSSPGLTELDILSLLTVGVTTSEARTSAAGFTGSPGQISTAEALAILSGTGLRPLERQVQKFVGIDTFQIDPSVSRVTGAAEPKLTVGKQLNRDLRVTYSTGLGGQGEQAVQLEYQLSNNLSLVAQWDEVDSFGGGVKFRFQFR